MRRRLRPIYLLADVVMLALAAAAAAVGTDDPSGSMPFWWVGFAAVTLAGLRTRGLYSPRLDVSPLDDLGRIFATTAIAAMVVISLRVVVESDPDAASEIVRFWAFATVYLGAGRAGIALARRRGYRRGEGLANALIVGAGDVGRLMAARLLARPELGFRPVGFLDKDPPEGVDLPVPLLGASWDLDRVVEAHSIRHVIVTFSTAPHNVLLGLVRRCRSLDVDVSVVPRLFEEVTHRVSVQHLGGVALVRVHQADPRGWQFAAKYATDRLLAALFLVLLAPVLLAVSLILRARDGGPILYRHPRIGLDGREFDMLKFRTMTGAGEADEPLARSQATVEQIEEALARIEPALLVAPGGLGPPSWAVGALGAEGDAGRDRLVPRGRFLRRYSLDELPQLLNVMKGQMSLVGPRPERPAYARAFERRIPRYRDRFRVKPGITGWAQINGLRGQTSLVDRIEWDNYYIENWGPWLDLKILGLTVPAILNRRSAS
jgi:exopolysaccharide biosynthesis polyprenyl glycosylphosphotransferase